MSTLSAKPGTVERRWYVVDAEGQNLGRLASVIAETLAGKRSPWYTRHCDTGDFVVVVNAGKVTVTGNKLRDKRYWRHSGYPGGIRSRTREINRAYGASHRRPRRDEYDDDGWDGHPAYH